VTSQIYVPKHREGTEVVVDTTSSTRIYDGKGPSFVQKSSVEVQNKENVGSLQLGRSAHTITPSSVDHLQEECEGPVDVVL
jgi:hypothetical protein